MEQDFSIACVGVDTKNTAMNLIMSLLIHVVTFCYKSDKENIKCGHTSPFLEAATAIDSSTRPASHSKDPFDLIRYV